MKKILLSVCTLGVLFASSCKKSDSGSGSSNSWTLGGTTYTPAMVGSSMGILSAADASSNACSFSFAGSATPTAGTYKVVSVAPGTGEVMVTVTKSGTNVYTASTVANTSATVTVNGGKITVVLPNTTVVNALTGTDSLTLSANLTQTN